MIGIFTGHLVMVLLTLIISLNCWTPYKFKKFWKILKSCSILPPKNADVSPMFCQIKWKLWNYFFYFFQDCRQPFQGGSFFDHEGLPYCETHYHAKRGSLCAGCSKPITGRCITAMFKKFHPEHFVCAFCLRQLNKGTFKEQNDKPYCHGCFDKLFG